MTLVSDYIAAAVAALSSEVAPQRGDLGYGRDLDLEADLATDAGVVDGVTLLAQACYRRLTTPRGSVPDDPDYGQDLRAYLQEPTTVGELRALEGQTRSELRKDDRIDTVDALAAVDSTGRTITVTVSVVPIDPVLGPFKLVVVLDASTLSATLALVQAEGKGQS